MIVPADAVSEIRIEPLFSHAEFTQDPKRIVVQFFPWNGQMDEKRFHSYDWIKESPEMILDDWHFDGKAIVFRKRFCGEQEFNVQVLEKNDAGVVKRKRNFHLYSLKPDLYALRPFRGDIHIHTTGSDGQEEPRYTAARFRELGMDFAAISDHRNYEPSIVAMEYWRDINPDYKLFPCEEVHAPGSPVHVLNFGGRYSVHKMSYEREEAYRKEVAEIEKSLPEDLSCESRFAVASAEWVFREVKKAGGLAVFCHPYWYTEQYVINSQVTDAIFANRNFDAFELLGGFKKCHVGSNNLQVVRYYEECARGNVFPVTGSDDCHATDRFMMDENRVDSRNAELTGWFSTIVFARSCAYQDLADAVRNGFSAALERIEGEMPRCYSSLRLAQYGLFLQKWYFPMHDVLCAAEGALMLRVLAGDENARQALKSLSGSVRRYQESVFARSPGRPGNAE